MESKTSLVTLQENSTKFKLVIPTGVLEKIEYICKKVSSVEWSGILFYTVEGGFEKEDLVLTASDLFVQNIGSQTFTEFEISPEIAGYIVDNNLIGHQMGLIHSHNSMATFFSGTDSATLLSEGQDRNHFLSLIVNNAGSYTAKITRKVHYIENNLISYDYSTFEGKEIKEENLSLKEDFVVVEAFTLDITKEERAFPEIDTLLEDLRKKAASSKMVYPKTWNGQYPKPKIGYTAYLKDEEEVSAGQGNKAQQEFPFTKKTTQDTIQGNGSQTGIDEVESEHTIPYGTIYFSEDIVDRVVKEILVGSPVVIPVNFDPMKFCQKMDDLYSERFPQEEEFEEWMASYLEFLLYNSVDPEIGTLNCSAEEEAAILAYGLAKAFSKLPQNKWIEYIEDLLEAYII